MFLCEELSVCINIMRFINVYKALCLCCWCVMSPSEGGFFLFGFRFFEVLCWFLHFWGVDMYVFVCCIAYLTVCGCVVGLV